jgi:hypothetical protein
MDVVSYQISLLRAALAHEIARTKALEARLAEHLCVAP